MARTLVVVSGCRGRVDSPVRPPRIAWNVDHSWWHLASPRIADTTVRTSVGGTVSIAWISPTSITDLFTSNTASRTFVFLSFISMDFIISQV